MPDKIRPGLGLIVGGLFIIMSIIRIFYPTFGDLPTSVEATTPYPTMTPRPVATPKTDCTVTINGKPALILENGVNRVKGHDEVDVICPTSSEIESIFVSKPDLDDLWLAIPDTQKVFSYKTFGKDLGLKDAASINIFGKNEDELDIYILDLEN